MLNAPFPHLDLAGVPAADDPQRGAFKAAMRHMAGAVCVVAFGAGREIGGLTATSVTSLSTDPPSLLVCVKRSVSGLDLLRRSGKISVNVLRHDHEAVAERFAGRDGRRGAARFDGADWVFRTDRPPVLADALAAFECDIEECIERHTHTIVIGRIAASHVGGGGALVYWQAAYAALVPPRLT